MTDPQEIVKEEGPAGSPQGGYLIYFVLAGQVGNILVTSR